MALSEEEGRARHRERQRRYAENHGDDYLAAHAARQRRRRERDSDSILRADQRYTQFNPDRYRRRRIDPERRRDRRLVYKAVRRGDLLRPDACEQCGLPCKAQAHHDDYPKPLEVSWLCRRCHGRTWRFHDA